MSDHEQEEDSRSAESSHSVPWNRNPSMDSGYSNLNNVAIQRATRGYPSSPLGQERAHTLTLPPSAKSSSNGHSRSRHERQSSDRHRDRSGHRSRDTPHAKRPMRSMSEKVLRDSTVPVTRSRSSPAPVARSTRSRGFWRQVEVFVKVVVSKFRPWGGR